MKKFVNGRSQFVFALTTAIMIGVTSFLHGYSDGAIGLLPPILIVLLCGTLALTCEMALSRQVK